MLLGKNYINGTWVGSNETAQLEGTQFSQASIEQVNDACIAAKEAFRPYSQCSREQRAVFLETIAEEINKLGDSITETGMKETGLPEGRLIGERGRTTGQLQMFADLIRSDDFLDTRIVEAMPDRKPLPLVDLRLTHRPIGPVVVFGASNFPLAFSTGGGDTASALAAGCPVIVKGHGAHAGTAELVGQAIDNAIKICKMPSGTFQLVQGSGKIVGTALVKHEAIRAVGFTGSTQAGRILYDLCHSRPTPIPFYGELGSINPVFCLPKAVEERGAEIGTAWAGSLTMGAGQFCTNPGVVIGVKGDAFTKLQESAVAVLNTSDEQTMLTDAICDSYHKGVSSWRDSIEELTSKNEATGKRCAKPAAFRTSAANWLSTPQLHHEVFGSAGIFIECNNVEEMNTCADAIDGQLTITLQLDVDDYSLAKALIPILEEKAGRILCNGYPTGVEVCSAMMHGGPYPASTDVRSTSVGTLAINRWLRPVSYQNFPQQLLHGELR